MIEGVCSDFIIVNYVVEESFLSSKIPPSYRVSRHNGKCYLSLVVYTFNNPRFMGIKIPKRSFHIFSLRTYVQTPQSPGGIGIVNLKEIVSGRLVAFFNSLLFDQIPRAVPIWFSSKKRNNSRIVQYIAKRNVYHSLRIKTDKASVSVSEIDEAFFFVRQFDLFPAKGSDPTITYSSYHPAWDVFPVKSVRLKIKFGKLFGKEFRFLNQPQPESVFLAKGSALSIRPKTSRSYAVGKQSRPTVQ